MSIRNLSRQWFTLRPTESTRFRRVQLHVELLEDRSVPSATWFDHSFNYLLNNATSELSALSSQMLLVGGEASSLSNASVSFAQNQFSTLLPETRSDLSSTAGDLHDVARSLIVFGWSDAKTAQLANRGLNDFASSLSDVSSTLHVINAQLTNLNTTNLPDTTHTISSLLQNVAVNAGNLSSALASYSSSAATSATISGSITNDPTGSGVSDSSGLANVPVQLVNQNGVVISTTSTDSSGKYSFSPDTNGQYLIRVVAPQGYTQTSPSSTESTPSVALNAVPTVTYTAALVNPAATPTGPTDTQQITGAQASVNYSGTPVTGVNFTLHQTDTSATLPTAPITSDAHANELETILTGVVSSINNVANSLNALAAVLASGPGLGQDVGALVKTVESDIRTLQNDLHVLGGLMVNASGLPFAQAQLLLQTLLGEVPGNLSSIATSLNAISASLSAGPAAQQAAAKSFSESATDILSVGSKLATLQGNVTTLNPTALAQTLNTGGNELEDASIGGYDAVERSVHYVLARHGIA